MGKHSGHCIRGALLVLAFGALAAACQRAENPSGQPAARSPSEHRQRLQREAEAFIGRSVSELASDSAATRLGERLFDAHCVSCHGLEAPAKRGITDLRNGTFNYGDSEQSLRATISQGRLSIMPGVGHELGEVDLGQLVAFVQLLEFESPLSSYAERGKELFAANCASCHGADGLGNPELGASNLADVYWQHGESMMNIRLVITRGVQSHCPGYRDGSTEPEIDLLTAFVLGLRKAD